MAQADSQSAQTVELKTAGQQAKAGQLQGLTAVLAATNDNNSATADDPDVRTIKVISYVDRDTNQEVGSYTVKAKVGDKVDVAGNVESHIPSGYKEAYHGTVPGSVTVDSTVINNNKPIQTFTLIKDVEYILIRTITEHLPDGTNKNIFQYAIHETVSRVYGLSKTNGDLVSTGAVGYRVEVGYKVNDADTITLDKTKTKTSTTSMPTVSWSEFQVDQIDGYTASQSSVPEKQAIFRNDVTKSDGTIEGRPAYMLDQADIYYTADSQTAKVQYIDVDNGNKVVATGSDISGKVGDTVQFGTAEHPLNIPINYQLVGEKPSYTFTNAANQVVQIKLSHIIKTVTPDTPKDQIPSGVIPNDPYHNTYPNIDQNTMKKYVTRTINVTDPKGKTTTTKQTVTFKQNYIVDLVNGYTTTSLWRTGADEDDTYGTWDAYPVTNYDGYTTNVEGDTSQKTDVDWNTPNATVNITYTAKDQSTHIIYQDTKGNKVQTDEVDGKTDQTVATNSKVPAGWKISDSSTVKDVSSTITFKGASTPDTTITIEHNTITVKPGDLPNPGAKKQGNKNKKPGDGTPNTDITYQTLHQTVTRKVTVNDPHTGTKTTTESPNFVRTATIDDFTGDVTYSSWTPASDKGKFGQVDVPDVAGYDPNVDGSTETVTPSQDQITDGKVPDVTINYTAKDQQTHIIYQDNDRNVIKTDGVSGKTDQTVDVHSSVPAGWKISDGSAVKKVPSQIKFTGDPTHDTVITIEHAHKTINPDQPVQPGDKTPSGKEINGAHDSDLNQTITRTINVTDPHKGALKPIVQTAHISRTAVVDEVTGDVTYGSWSTDSDNWTAYNTPAVDGYTPSQTKVDPVTVADGQKDVTVDVTYTANKQFTHIIYQDKDGKAIKTDTVNGKTDQTVDTNSKVPAGWKIVKGSVPATISFTAKQVPDTVITIEHNKITVNPGDLPNPGKKMPGNPDKKPGDGQPSKDITYKDLHKTITRTITINDPHQPQPQVFTQTLPYERTATIDDVTGEVTYGDWKPAGLDSFIEMPISDIPGYSKHFKNGEPSKMTPTQDQINNWTDPNIIVDYTANPGTQTVNYVNGDQTIHSQKVQGNTDETVSVPNEIPAGWELVPGQKMPVSTKIPATDNDPIIVKTQHAHRNVTPDNPVKPGENNKAGKPINGAHQTDLNQTITRTINVTDPHTGLHTTTQTAHISRSATVDEVTGDVTYGDWSTDDSSWSEYDVPTVPGYTASQDKVDAVTVKDGQKDVTVNVTYTANDQATHIIYKDASGKVIKTDTVNGKTDQTVDTKSTVPAGWKIADSSTVKKVPDKITFTGASTKDTVTIVDHAHKTIQPTDPVKPGEKTPDGKNPIKGAHHDDLNQTITRTINVTDPHTGLHTTTQKASLTRTADADEVTGDVAYSDWTQGSWPEYDVPTVPGYTASQNKVDKVTVADGQKNVVVNITYTANDGRQTINYVDEHGNKIHTQVVAGKTDQTVTVTPEVPAGWELVDQVPTTVTIQPSDNPINVRIKHQVVKVTPDAPKTPADIMPNDGGKHFPAGVGQDDLNQTIKVSQPDGHVITETQTVHLTRTATVDKVSGQVSYGSWTTGHWDAYNVPTIPGYTPSQAVVTGQDVTVDTSNTEVDISYQRNAQANGRGGAGIDAELIQDPSNPANSQASKDAQAQRKLPQTGNSHASLAAIGLGLLSFLGLGGLGKKKED